MEEKLLSILEEICDDEIVREDKDVDLFETDLIDSLGVVSLMVAIEEEFGITLAPTEIESSRSKAKKACTTWPKTPAYRRERLPMPCRTPRAWRWMWKATSRCVALRAWKYG